MTTMKSLFEAERKAADTWAVLYDAQKNAKDPDAAALFMKLMDIAHQLDAAIEEALDPMFDDYEDYMNAYMVALKGGDPGEIMKEMKEAV